MSRSNPRLTVASIAWNLKNRPDKPTKFADLHRGLYLLIGPTGKAQWRRDYTFAGKTHTYTMGHYPVVTLAMARNEAERVQGLLDLDQDPTADREARRLAAAVANTDRRFRAAAAGWVGHCAPGWTEPYAQTMKQRLADDILPVLGAMPLADITREKILDDVMAPILERCTPESARQVADVVSSIFRYAIDFGLASANPAQGLLALVEQLPMVHLPTGAASQR